VFGRNKTMAHLSGLTSYRSGRYLTSAVCVDMVLSKPDGVAMLAESVNAVLALSIDLPN